MKILITDYFHPLLYDSLIDSGVSVRKAPDISARELHLIIEEFDGIILSTKTIVDKTFLDKAKKLKFIARVGSGLDNINVEYAEQKGIEVLSSPEGNANAVAEYAIGALLSVMRNIPKASAEVRGGMWFREENRGMEVSGKTVGIIGYGNTGGLFARKIKSFDCRILVYDKYKTGFSDNLIEEASLQQIKEVADIISFHVPLNGETKYYFDESFLNGCNKPIILINTSRGMVVKTSALIRGLKDSKITHAVLDVLENESFESFSPDEQEEFNILLAFDSRVQITPHIAGWTFESKKRLVEIIVKKIKRWL